MWMNFENFGAIALQNPNKEPAGRWFTRRQQQKKETSREMSAILLTKQIQLKYYINDINQNLCTITSSSLYEADHLHTSSTSVSIQAEF